jgi:selenocysteine-specific translation elongation factor
MQKTGLIYMGNITVAILGATGYSGQIGKKGTSTDITLYDLKKGEATVTLIEPTRYPERLAPLFYTCALSTKALVVVDELNAALASNWLCYNAAQLEAATLCYGTISQKKRSSR